MNYFLQIWHKMQRYSSRIYRNVNHWDGSRKADELASAANTCRPNWQAGRRVDGKCPIGMFLSLGFEFQSRNITGLKFCCVFRNRRHLCLPRVRTEQLYYRNSHWSFRWHRPTHIFVCNAFCCSLHKSDHSLCCRWIVHVTQEKGSQLQLVPASVNVGHMRARRILLCHTFPVISRMGKTAAATINKHNHRKSCYFFFNFFANFIFL